MAAGKPAADPGVPQRGLRGVIERHPLASFLLLAFPLSWSIVPLTGGAGMLPMGPLLAAAIVTAAVGGRSEVRAWLRRSVSPRGPLRWHAIAVGVIVGIYALGAMLAFALGAEGPSGEELRAWPEILFVFPLYLFVIAGPEESGWRGFALPRLQRTRGSLQATAILGVVVAAWHLPLVVSGEQVAVVLVAIFASQFIFTWLQSRTDGSVPVVMVAHAAQGGIAGAYLGPMFSGSDQTLQVSIWAGLLVLAAVAAAAASRRHRESPAPALAAG
jgi:membrane protease YdiL (CAAX protease family)